MKNKILLIFPGKYIPPPVQLMPMSVISLIAPLVQNGFEPMVIDQRVDKDWKNKVINFCNDSRALFAGISTLTGTTIKYGIEVAKYIRFNNSNIPLVWGGVHPTLIPIQTLQNEFVDIVSRNEGEKTVVEIAKALQNQIDLLTVKGISFKKNGEIINNLDEEFIDLDVLPPMDFSCIDENNYKVNEYFQYQTSRGCPHRCDFCDVIAFNRRKLRKKSINKVLEELEYIYNKFHPLRIEFLDDNFLVDVNRVEQICVGLKERKLHFQWTCTCRADYSKRLSLDFLKFIKSAGCSEIYVGAESGSQKILDLIHKDCKVEDIFEIAQKICLSGIRFNCNFMCGFPGETRQDIEETILLIKRMVKFKEEKNVDLLIGGMLIYAPYPGTPLFEKIKKLGFCQPQKFEDWASLRHNRIENIVWHDLEYQKYIFCVSMTLWDLITPKSNIINVKKIINQNLYHKISNLSLSDFFLLFFSKIWLILKKISYYRFKYDLYKFPFECYIMNYIKNKIVGW